MSASIDVFANLKKNNHQEDQKKEEKKPENKEATKAIKDILKPTPTKDDPKTKMKLIYSIQHYGKNKRFGEYLKTDCGHNFTESYLKSLSVEQLELELEKQLVAISNKNNNSLIDTSFEKFLTFVEDVIHNRSKYKIKGTTDRLFKDEHFLDLLEIIKLKYNVPFIKLDPVLEISLIVLQTAFVQHQTNSLLGDFKTNVDLDEEI